MRDRGTARNAIFLFLCCGFRLQERLEDSVTPSAPVWSPRPYANRRSFCCPELHYAVPFSDMQR